ncbi:MAG: hypothetical protein ACKVZJ_07840 [Phycisphaerales bacterium]
MVKRKKFVEVSPLTDVQRADDVVESCGLPLKEFDGLGECFLKGGYQPKDGVPDFADEWIRFRQWLHPAAEAWKHSNSVASAVVALLETMLGERTIRTPAGETPNAPINLEHLRGWIKSRQLDLLDGVARLGVAGASNSGGLRLNAAYTLLRNGLVAPEVESSLPLLAVHAQQEEIFLSRLGGDKVQSECEDPRRPGFWVMVEAEAYWAVAEPRVRQLPREEQVKTVRGLAVVAWGMAHHARGRHRTQPDFMLEVRRLWQRLFFFLDDLIANDVRNADRLARKTWFELWYEAWNGRAELEAREGVEDRLLKAADHEIGTLRAAMAQPDRAKAQAELDSRRHELSFAAHVLFDKLPVWEAMRPLLLLFRALPEIAVTPDLRAWNEHGHQASPPWPWCRVPEILIVNVQGWIGEERGDDSDLVELRTAFCRFCLDRLKTSKDGEGPVEKNAFWRIGFIHAADVLAVNPGDRKHKGHHTLHHAAQHDPDPDVRDAAKSAHERMRHGPTLNEGSSPRVLILRALWWLRQAQVLALGGEIDGPGAQRTRDTEVRRFTERQRDHRAGFSIGTELS